MLRTLIGVFVLVGNALLAQTSSLISQDALFQIPGRELPESSDLSAKVRGSISPDSIFFDVEVTDDQIQANTAGTGDRIEIWFGSPWVNFSDYIIGEKGKKTFIFRKTAEAGDDANLERFIRDADYPKGKLKDAETGKDVKPVVPDANSLRREYVFFGMTRFGLSASQQPAKHLDRDKYGPFEKQTGLTLDDLSPFVNYTVTKTATGLHYHVAMHNKCLGFGRVASMNKIRFVVDVIDADPGEVKEQVISTTSNRFYGRPYYFNQTELAFPLNILPSYVPAHILERMQINLDVIYSGGTWKTFGWNSGGIVYAKEFVSEALTEFYFYTIDISYQKIPEGQQVEHERVELKYDDVSIFPQHEVYLLLNNEIYSGKDYRYTGHLDNNFFNTIFRLPDGSTAMVLYDYEVVDPLGFGQFGHTADEFIFIERVVGKEMSPLINIGQRIEAAATLVVGENSQFKVTDVKSVEYAWVEFGKLFEVRIKGKTSDSSRILRYRINEEGKIVDSK